MNCSVSRCANDSVRYFVTDPSNMEQEEYYVIEASCEEHSYAFREFCLQELSLQEAQIWWVMNETEVIGNKDSLWAHPSDWPKDENP